MLFTVLAKKCAKKEVVSFWFIFLPDRSFCPLKSGVSEVSFKARRINFYR